MQFVSSRHFYGQQQQQQQHRPTATLGFSVLKWVGVSIPFTRAKRVRRLFRGSLQWDKMKGTGGFGDWKGSRRLVFE